MCFVPIFANAGQFDPGAMTGLFFVGGLALLVIFINIIGVLVKACILRGLRFDKKWIDYDVSFAQMEIKSKKLRGSDRWIRLLYVFVCRVSQGLLALMAIVFFVIYFTRGGK